MVSYGFNILSTGEGATLMALASGVCDKAVASLYERTRRPTEFCYPNWVARCSWQITDTLTALDTAFASAKPYVFGTQLTYVELFTFVAIQFVRKTCIDLVPPGKFARLERLEAQLEALDPVFVNTRP